MSAGACLVSLLVSAHDSQDVFGSEEDSACLGSFATSLLQLHRFDVATSLDKRGLRRQLDSFGIINIASYRVTVSKTYQSLEHQDLVRDAKRGPISSRSRQDSHSQISSTSQPTSASRRRSLPTSIGHGSPQKASRAKATYRGRPVPSARPLSSSVASAIRGSCYWTSRL